MYEIALYIIGITTLQNSNAAWIFYLRGNDFDVNFVCEFDKMLEIFCEVVQQTIVKRNYSVHSAMADQIRPHASS
ncbi:MAG: hypothetical protein KZQ60_12670 [Candidatus Thiodiazotropha sp. (ex Lucinoma aequizonata)]|nr:hypothetical protein [Candidatus Thiodiazotropha sp. (ex Lucinoma aequizonata)]MCU7912633.1 hypothetical protein [Candidatus Thiodiazotropha sp. (ex Lucinoma aequizonata)]